MILGLTCTSFTTFVLDLELTLIINSNSSVMHLYIYMMQAIEFLIFSYLSLEIES